jgi:C1A family cysteine protease
MEKKYYGWVPQPIDERDHQFFSVFPNAGDLPKSVDLRNPNLPIVNQGRVGSCGANASASIFLFEELKGGEADINFKSRLFIYYYARLLMGTVKQDSGVDNRTLMKSLSKYGTCDESLWPYDISKFKTKPSKVAINAAIHKLKEYLSLQQTLFDLKSSLAQGHPFMLGFNVPESFESAEMAKTGIMKMPKFNEQIIGGHDAYSIGYDDYKQIFMIGNSWGEDWGQKGYFEMPYEFIQDPKWVQDFWSFRLVS